MVLFPSFLRLITLDFIYTEQLQFRNEIVNSLQNSSTVVSSHPT
jgi:hypothetical protein